MHWQPQESALDGWPHGHLPRGGLQRARSSPAVRRCRFGHYGQTRRRVAPCACGRPRGGACGSTGGRGSRPQEIGDSPLLVPQGRQAPPCSKQLSARLLSPLGNRRAPSVIRRRYTSSYAHAVNCGRAGAHRDRPQHPSNASVQVALTSREPCDGTTTAAPTSPSRSRWQAAL